MSKSSNLINDFIRGKLAQDRAKTEQFAKRLFGDKVSDDYIKGYTDGAYMATERAVDSINKAYEGETNE
jgi:hypothetical protein